MFSKCHRWFPIHPRIILQFLKIPLYSLALSNSTHQQWQKRFHNKNIKKTYVTFLVPDLKLVIVADTPELEPAETDKSLNSAWSTWETCTVKSESNLLVTFNLYIPVGVDSPPSKIFCPRSAIWIENTNLPNRCYLFTSLYSGHRLQVGWNTDFYWFQ